MIGILELRERVEQAFCATSKGECSFHVHEYLVEIQGSSTTNFEFPIYLWSLRAADGLLLADDNADSLQEVADQIHDYLTLINPPEPIARDPEHDSKVAKLDQIDWLLAQALEREDRAGRDDAVRQARGVLALLRGQVLS